MAELITLEDIKSERFTTDQPIDSYQSLEEYCAELRERVELNNRILLVKGLQCKPETFDLDVAKNRCYYAYPPTGLQCLAEAVKRNNNGERNLEVRILDLNFEFLNRVINDPSFDPNTWLSILDEKLDSYDPSVVGAANLFSSDTPPFIQILEHLNSSNKRRVVLAGGQNATYDGKTILKDGLCDAICKYESENKINFFLDTLYDFPEKSPRTSGILFKHQGKIIETDGEKDVVELKGNLIETYELIAPIEEYCKVGTIGPYLRMNGQDKPFATILMNRGCHGACDFCGVPEFSGREVRSKPTKDVLDELEYLYREKGVRHFEFLDDDLAVYKNKFAEVLRGMKGRGLTEMSWASNNGIIASCLDENLMKEMVDSKCIGFKIGVESGNEATLRRVGKPGTIKKFEQFSKMAQSFPEMFMADNYILGLPNLDNPKVSEPWGLIMKDYHFSRQMGLDWSCYFVYQPSVSYFGDRKEGDNNYISEFVPSNKARKGMLFAPEGVAQGPDVFSLPLDSIPSVAQVEQAQITFNLVRNFVMNKNLTPEGSLDKYTSWVSAVQERYPSDASMSIFLSLAYRLKEDHSKADVQYAQTRENLTSSSYWQERFRQFRLYDVMNNFPQNRSQAEQAVSYLRSMYDKY